MDIKFEIKGDEALIRKMINTGIVQGELMRATNSAAIAVHRRAANYPPKPPGSRYVRTNRLGGSWAMQTRAFGQEVQGWVTNPTEYAPLVMDPTKQAWMHQGRWATTRKILEEQRQKILGFYQDAVRRINKALT